ncbi:MAG: hypothetical protein ACLFVO_06115 [Chloroflexaceae bacterium]
MKQHGVWYIDERAEQLAIVYLTRRDDLAVIHPPGDATGLDYLVQIQADGRRTTRQFGVTVDGVLTHTLSESRPNDSISNFNSVATGDILPDIPVCALLFVMKSDTGYYRWIREPVVTDSGAVALIPRPDSHFSRLDTAALDRIVAQVNAWYAARAAQIDEKIG